jgi:Ala-tRNA(Pro) deacylase
MPRRLLTKNCSWRMEGLCSGLDLIVDESIEAQPVISIEAGDHQTLLHLSHAQFARLTANALHERFSGHD